MRKRHHLVIVAAIAVLASACGGVNNGATPTASAGGVTSSGQPAAPVTLTFWHGYTDVEADSLKALIDEWNAQNPNITIKPLFVNNDNALQKLTVALQGGQPPDITYQYGSSLP
jgi:multiple sugar transport system substrate-binding protein